jgi:uncharacterized protein (TIGR00251 family)
MSSWYRLDADRNVLCIKLYVQPGARRTEVAGKHGECLKVRVAAPAVEYRANAVLVEFLGQKLDLPASRVIITRGARGRNKTVEILGPGAAALKAIQDWDRT